MGTASSAVVAIQIGYCVSDIISKCGVGLIIYQVTYAKSNKDGALLPCTAFPGRGGDFVADYMDLVCGFPLPGLSTRPPGNFLAASAAPLKVTMRKNFTL